MTPGEGRAYPDRPIPEATIRALPATHAALLGSLSLLGSGCLRSYQPMKGLAAPVVVDRSQRNLEGVELRLRCDTPRPLQIEDGRRLCEQARLLFQGQGARVREAGQPSAPPPELLPAEATDAGPAAARDEGTPAPPSARIPLELTLRSWQVHEDRHFFSWLACAATFTLVPGWTERTWAQRVTVRDERGVVLEDRHLELRIIRRFGVGALVGALVDQVARPPSRQVTGAASDKALSADLYDQLSQTVFDAWMRDRTRRAAEAR